ncbi:virulence factor TspB C-terminal domain-related protein [Acinetobacter sp. YH16055]|uniref:virulence factor TspB C-terminal domain-related protein n=1 Tax=Acinetobacter sp. YH16055 TaxID=2601193 RepID=UPI0015D437FE|nr:virulence factor TspB C-terminal domain-related protein [Acinetobacter sp. YH16055]
MVNSIRVLFCALACFFSITVYSSNDPVRDNWDKHLKNQEAYQMHTQRAASEVRASISMTPEKRANVKQMLDRQGLLQDGSKVKIGASVTRPVDTAKVASTLVDRLKNAKDYAKKVGKASIPAFVGTAAFHGLMEGIDWVMDEGGNVTKKPDPLSSCGDGSSCPASQIIYTYNAKLEGYFPSIEAAAAGHYKNVTCVNSSPSGYEKHPSSNSYRFSCSDGKFTSYYSAQSKPNPFYSSSSSEPPSSVPVSDADLQTALKNALESNNPALAAAIAEAMKAAYTQDNSEGQPKTTNPLIAEIQDDMQNAVDGALDNPTTSGGTAERPSGHYKITDGEKTIEGYVTPSDTSGQTNTDTESNTVTDPITGNQTTTGTSTGSIQFPAFCDWAGIVCEWIGWTKEEPEEPQIEPPVIEQIDIPFVPFSITQFNATCPPDQQLSLDLMGTNQSFVLPMTPFCDFFSSIKPFVIALASFFAVKLIGNGAFNSGN